MVRKITGATRIPVPGGKVIDEYIGLVNSGDDQVSIAHMSAPAGWEEPAQTPEFTEYTLVLRGTVVVEHDEGVTEVNQGEAFVSLPGEKIRYTVGADGAEYISVCTPAFSPDTVNRDD